MLDASEFGLGGLDIEKLRKWHELKLMGVVNIDHDVLTRGLGVYRVLEIKMPQ